MANYLVAGGSGFVGRHLCRSLADAGAQVYVLSTRKPLPAPGPNLHWVYWDTRKGEIDPAFSLQDAVIINLAGAGVADKRWTAARKEEILSSRVQSLDTLYRAAERGQIGVKLLVSASAIGYYGPSETACTEDQAPANDFLGQTCLAWEEGAKRFEALGIGVARMRIGLVLHPDGGMLKEFMKSLRFGVAGIPGSGKQVYSWIHLADLVKALQFAAEQRLAGAYNAVAPEPCTVGELTEALIAARGKPALRAHAPEFMLRLLMGEMAVEVLKSCRVSSRRLEESGFAFSYRNIDAAMNSFQPAFL